MGSLLSISCNSSTTSPHDPQKALHDELQALNLDKYLDAVPYASHAPYPPDPTWEIYSYDTAVCRCLTGDPFHIGVKQKGSSQKVVFLMSGGGACWPGKDACATTADFVTGWDDSLSNPLNGWNVIQVPYCDGSVHMGDNDADYDHDQQVDHYHWGLKNTTAAIAIMRELFPNPLQVFITGCSAGGFGTFMAYLLIRRFFPDSEIFIFNDSGPGLWNPDNGMKQLVQDAWHYQSYFPASCALCDDQIMYLYDWLLQRDSQATVGLFSSYQDHVIGASFLDLAPDEYQALLVSTSDAIQRLHPASFKRFLIAGDSHCVGEVPAQYSYAVRGVTLLQWLGQMLRGDPDWQDILE